MIDMKRKFKRQCFWLKKLGDKWKRPKGRQSKLRHEKKGRWAVPKVGYGRASKERGTVIFKSQQVMPVLIRNMKELGNVGKSEVAVIASSVGARKSLMIIAEAEKRGIKIINRKAKAAKKVAETKNEAEKK